MTISITLFDQDGQMKLGKNDYEDTASLMTSKGENRAYIATQYHKYHEGDYFEIELSEPKQYLVVQLDQTLSPSTIFIQGKKWRYNLPLQDNWKESSSDISFKGKRHYISVRKAETYEIESYQNLTLNTHDSKEETGAYPHASANVETRNDSTFFALNAIDGIYANLSHGSYPFQSWGINQQDDAELKIDFGRPVAISELELTIRADFPHDNFWTKGTIEFSDGTEIKLDLIKTPEPQRYKIDMKETNWIKLKQLIKSQESDSPFPALTQIAAYGDNIVS
ncbi:hypothetical protein BKP56_10795 [Marinilactibacillus sp. 15R]|uniref:hypothetical protein n=1 Tax=Marinilactibacillus sp. 15R TaxID=1911586 RepID=UPI00090AE3AD|nr:hypothetical protein [Marinilactibacillus sp. 15R]API89716.1 hypothetical protein BKP56_10795 [Marinilactibacillus sp. 15R]